MEWLKPLLSLQSIDERLVQLNKKLTAVPLVAKSLESEILAVGDERKAAVKKLQDLEKELKRVEIDAEAESKHAYKLKAQSPMVKNKDEFAAMKAEMARAKENEEALEEQGIMLIEQIESYCVELETIKKELEERLTEIEAKKKKLATMETELAGQIDEGEQMRITAAAKVPEDMLKSYEQIRRRKKGLTPVCAELNDELKCGSCHLKNNAESRISVTKGKVVLCDNCGSILYLPGTV